MELFSRELILKMYKDNLRKSKGFDFIAGMYAGENIILRMMWNEQVGESACRARKKDLLGIR